MLTSEQPSTQALATAFVTAVGYQFASQFHARFYQCGRVSALHYVDEIEHPWPRAFKFKLELFAENGATAAEIGRSYRQHSGGKDAECVVDLLLANPAAMSAELNRYGFVPAFQKDLMARAIKPSAIASTTPTDLRVSQVDSAELVEHSALFGSEYQSDRGVLKDGRICDFVAWQGDALVATAQIVATDGGVVYVSRMFTLPEFRQRGACRTLLDAMHAHAYGLGMTHSVLVPSLMARKHRIYERLGYQACIPICLLVRGG